MFVQPKTNVMEHEDEYDDVIFYSEKAIVYSYRSHLDQSSEIKPEIDFVDFYDLIEYRLELNFDFLNR